MSGSPTSYRDRIYIVKDVILKLVEYGELNQTALVSFCGLNLKKHKSILEDIEHNELIQRREQLQYIVQHKKVCLFAEISLSPMRKCFQEGKMK
jgi:predicted transcriptional regulator